MTTKDEFLTRIANQLGRNRIASPPVQTAKGAPDFWQAYQLTEAEKVKRLADEIEELGGKAYIKHTKDELMLELKQLLAELKPASVLTWGAKFQAEWELDSILAEWNVLDWDQSSFLVDSLQTNVGITSVDYAIADTGSLVLCTNEEKIRVASLVPDVHIALVRSEQIRTRMGEVLQDFAQFQADQVPSSIHFISGPSRSSDIENDLSIGVHGPAALHVFILKTES